jgi:hypothetical protein
LNFANPKEKEKSLKAAEDVKKNLEGELKRNQEKRENILREIELLRIESEVYISKVFSQFCFLFLIFIVIETNLL